MKRNRKLYPAGDFAIWIIIYIELFTFALLFVGYAFTRRANLEMFNSSQLLLDTQAGFINTLLLITSSYFVVKSVQSIQHITHIKKANTFASKWLLSAMVLGVLFSINKFLEFQNIFSQGITLSTNTFYMFYLMLTIFHFMHVILGIVILFTVFRNTQKQKYSQKNYRGLETGASYWHMVDLLWIILFPLVYIMH